MMWPVIYLLYSLFILYNYMLGVYYILFEKTFFLNLLNDIHKFGIKMIAVMRRVKFNFPFVK